MRKVVVCGGLLLGCGGEGDGKDDPTVDEEPLTTWACVHIAEGTVIDGGATREEAPTLALGRSPWRVNLLTGVPNYVRFQVETPGDYTLLTDEADAVPAVWAGEARLELPGGEPNPECPADLPEVQTLSLEAGEHWLEIGPLFQGNLWLVLGQ